MTKAPKASYEVSQTRPRRRPDHYECYEDSSGGVIVVVGEAVGDAA